MKSRYVVATRETSKGRVEGASAAASGLGFNTSQQISPNIVIIESDLAIVSIQQAFGDDYIVEPEHT